MNGRIQGRLARSQWRDRRTTGGLEGVRNARKRWTTYSGGRRFDRGGGAVEYSYPRERRDRFERGELAGGKEGRIELLFDLAVASAVFSIEN